MNAPTGNMIARMAASGQSLSVIVAKVAEATVIYSSDKDVKDAAGGDMEVVGVLDLPLPPEDPQGSFL